MFSQEDFGVFYTPEARNFKHNFRIRGVIPYTEPLENGFLSTIWSFCFGSEPTQEEILSTIVNMWLRYVTTAYIMIVPKNQVITIYAEDMEIVDEAMEILMQCHQ